MQRRKASPLSGHAILANVEKRDLFSLAPFSLRASWISPDLRTCVTTLGEGVNAARQVFSAERSVEVVAEKLRPDTIGTLLG